MLIVGVSGLTFLKWVIIKKQVLDCDGMFMGVDQKV